MPDKKSPSGGTLQMRRRVASDPQSSADIWIHPLIVTRSSRVQLAATRWPKKRRRGVGDHSQRHRGGKQQRRPGEETRDLLRAALQGEEGVLRPFGLRAGAGGGSGRVSRVRPRGRRDGVGDLCPFLKELIELCQIHTLVVEREKGVCGKRRVLFAQRRGKRTVGGWERTLPSLVTPSSEPSPFWRAQ